VVFLRSVFPDLKEASEEHLDLLIISSLQDESVEGDDNVLATACCVSITARATHPSKAGRHEGTRHILFILWPFSVPATLIASQELLF